jgi:hypothetical protein
VLEDWVLRGDFLFTAKDNIQTEPLAFSERDHYQQLVGVDRVFENWTFGGQLQSDFTYKRNFVGVKVENAASEFWKPSVMMFVSDRNSDQWFQLKNAFEAEKWSVNVVFDSLNGKKSADGLFGLYRKNDRVLVEIARSY